MRRISDGVKIVKSYRTTESVERAFLDEKNYNYLYEDDMGFNFMEPETFEHLRARVQRTPGLELPNPEFYARFSA